MFGFLPALSRLEIGAVLAVVGLVAFGSWLLVHDAKVASRAASKTISKIEKANTNATNLGKRAADRSSDNGVRGQRDPSTRDD